MCLDLILRHFILEFVWNGLDAGTRLQLVAARNDFRLQGGLDFGTAETLYLLEILQEYNVNELNYESILRYLPSPFTECEFTGHVEVCWYETS